MNHLSSYPAGVSGNEYEIAGADYEREEELECNQCESLSIRIIEGYHGQEWFWCIDCSAHNILDVPEYDPEPDLTRETD